MPQINDNDVAERPWKLAGDNVPGYPTKTAPSRRDGRKARASSLLLGPMRMPEFASVLSHRPLALFCNGAALEFEARLFPAPSARFSHSPGQRPGNQESPTNPALKGRPNLQAPGRDAGPHFFSAPAFATQEEIDEYGNHERRTARAGSLGKALLR